ncbi:hypothetical protein ACQKKX_04890 [Neorhizobium sp. NPDC001467]|uniref:hypothetical protein n=1 Tax=Neorhizobium sp. NPDC001467 TaxID=3390595 RepID=UPI003D0830FC
MSMRFGRYSAIEEEDGSWSVVDTGSGMVMLLSGEPMVSLQERFAKALAEFMNLEEQHGGYVTLQ